MLAKNMADQDPRLLLCRARGCEGRSLVTVAVVVHTSVNAALQSPRYLDSHLPEVSSLQPRVSVVSAMKAHESV